MINRRHLIAGLAAAAVIGGPGMAQAPAQMRPAEAGMSAAQLEQLTQVADKYVANGMLSGVVTLVYRKGQPAYVSARGYQDVATKTPMQRDTIFALASMTKPITAVATMMLIEQGKLKLDDPVERWLPELANRKILNDPAGPLTSVHASPRPITVRDLLTYRMGIGVIAYAGLDDKSPIGQAYAGTSEPGLTADQFMARLGALPLVYAPGERFMYNTPSMVLGVLISRVSGMPYAQFLETRIFHPLGMKDTGFFVPDSKRSRVATVYSAPQGKLVAANRVAPSTMPIFPNAAGGLYSTADDYMQFARMMLGKGQLGKVRIISQKSVEAMTQDYLTTEAPKSFFINKDFWSSAGFGYALEVQNKLVGAGPNPGSYWWQGATGVAWTADPKADMIYVRMIQNLNPPAGFSNDFTTALYGAIQR